MFYIYIKFDKYFYDLFQNTDRAYSVFSSKLIIYASRFPSELISVKSARYRATFIQKSKNYLLKSIFTDLGCCFIMC